jgi:hypothetical protein
MIVIIFYEEQRLLSSSFWRFIQPPINPCALGLNILERIFSQNDALEPVLTAYSDI